MHSCTVHAPICSRVPIFTILSPTLMITANVKFTPLPRFGDVEAIDVVTRLPELALFSSDYPHFEGNADPISLYGDVLDDLGPAL